jgi:hypothetical protein
MDMKVEAIKFMFNSVTMLLFSSIHYGQAISDFSACRPQLNLSDLWNGRVKVNLSTTKSTVVHTLSSISASHEKVKHSHYVIEIQGGGMEYWASIL